MAEVVISDVDLGFAEKCDDRIRFNPLLYPSKLGGKPAWLRWDDFPSFQALTCGNCFKQTVFLCQIYVPMELKVSTESKEKESHHRTLFIFCCQDGRCFKNNECLKVYRSQIVDKDDDNEDDSGNATKLAELESQHPLCILCGCSGDKQCSMCHKVTYCCKDHQVIDWKYGHKKICKNNNNIQSILFLFYASNNTALTESLYKLIKLGNVENYNIPLLL